MLYARGVPFESEENKDAKGWLALDTVLDFVEENLFTSSADSQSPSEYAVNLTRRDTALALWSLTLERRLSAIESAVFVFCPPSVVLIIPHGSAYASRNQLDRLACLMIRSATPSPGKHSLSSGASVVFRRALGSASFWELRNVRSKKFDPSKRELLSDILV